LAVQERDNAKRQEQLAMQEKERADEASLDALKARYRAIAQSMAVKSLQLKDTDIKGLNAYQAYLFNKEYEGEEYDNYIYDGLYYANKVLTDDSKNLLVAHSDGINALVYTNDGKNLYSAGSDGNIIRWDLTASEQSPSILQTNNEIENRALALSPDNKWLAVGTTGNSIQLFDLTKSDPSPRRIQGHEGLVWDIKFMPDNSGFFSVGIDSTIRFYDFNELKVFTKGNVPYDAITISPDGSKIAAGDDAGNVTIFDTRNSSNKTTLPDENKDPVYSIAYNHRGDILAVSHAKGDEDVEIRIWDTSDYSLDHILTGHEARIDKLKFSRDDKLLASASHDGTVRLWVMDKLNNLPVVLNDHEGWVISIDFSPDGQYIITGTSIDQVRIWPTSPDMLAENFCNKLNRNMTENEWEQYVADDIDYIATCTGLNKE
jgi:WD40 repeat protein